MSGDTAANVVWGVLALMLVGSSLAARRLPVGQSVRMILAWVAIFSVGFVLFLFRGEAGVVWDRATAEFRGDSGKTVGRTLEVPQADDGHYWVNASINGTPERFLIDSGATVTTISSDVANAARIEPDSSFPVIVETANGRVEAQTARIERLNVGPITQKDAPVQISASLGETNLLGMSFLSKLKSWRVEGKTLVLTP